MSGLFGSRSRQTLDDSQEIQTLSSSATTVIVRTILSEKLGHSRLQFAFSTILNATRFGWQPLPGQLERRGLYAQVREMGFDGIEWSPRWYNFDRLDNKQVASLGREVTDLGMVVSAINLNRFMLCECPQAETHVHLLRRSIEVSAALKCSTVIISLSLPQPPTIDRPLVRGATLHPKYFSEQARILRLAARQASDCNVNIVLELHDDGLLDTPQQCLRMLSAIDQPNVTINPDLGNIVRTQPPTCSWEESLRLLGPRTGYWHVKNYRSGVPVAIWEGDIDYVQAFRTMTNFNYDGWVSIESYFGSDVLGLQRQSLNWLKNLSMGGMS